MRRLMGQRGPVFVVPGEVAQVKPNRRTWSRVLLKGGPRLLIHGEDTVVREALAGNSDEVRPRRSHFRLVEEVGGALRARDVAVEDIAALDYADEKSWCVVVLKGGETLRVVGEPAQIVSTCASPRSALKALGTTHESGAAAAHQVETLAPKKEGDA